MSVLLLRACLLEGRPAREAWDAWPGQVQDPIGGLHPRLVPSLAYNLERVGAAVDRPLRVHLQAGLLREERRYTRVREALDRVLDVLAAPPLIVKGPALAETVYPRPALRHCHDLDLVVSDPEAAREPLASLELGGLPVRLHRQVPGPPSLRLELSPARAWGKAALPDPARQLAAVLLLAFCHGAGRKNPTWALDAVHLIRSHPDLDWSLVPPIPPIGSMLGWLRTHLEVPIPPVAPGRLTRAQRAFAGLPGSLWDRLYPPAEVLAWRYPDKTRLERRLHHLGTRLPRPGPAATLPGPERTLLIGAATSRGKRARELFRDWNRAHRAQAGDPFLRRLLPLLSRRLPEPENRPFEVFYRDHVGRTRHLLEVVPGVVETLAGQGIDSLLLKGAALVRTCYDDPALRPMGDVDLLVRPDQFDQALALLLARGWGEHQPRLRAVSRSCGTRSAIATWRATWCTACARTTRCAAVAPSLPPPRRPPAPASRWPSEAARRIPAQGRATSRVIPGGPR